MKFEEEYEKIEKEKSIPVEILEKWIKEEKNRSKLDYMPKIDLEGKEEKEEIVTLSVEEIQRNLIFVKTEKAKNLLLFGLLSILGINTDGNSTQ